MLIILLVLRPQMHGMLTARPTRLACGIRARTFNHVVELTIPHLSGRIFPSSDAPARSSLVRARVGGVEKLVKIGHLRIHGVLITSLPASLAIGQQTRNLCGPPWRAP